MIRLLWRLLAFFLCIVTLGIVLVITPLGLDLCAPFINHISNDIDIEAIGVSGTLLGPININKLIVTQENNQYKITKTRLKWEISKLLLGHISVQELSADSVHILLGKNRASHTNEHFVPTTIQSLAVNHLTIVSQMRARPIVLTSIHGSAIVRKNTVAINTSAHVELPGISHVSIHLNGSTKHYSFYSTLWGDHTQTKLTGHGDQNHFSASIEPSKFLYGSISGNTDVTWHPQWQWAGKIQARGVHLNEWEKSLPIINTTNISSHGYLDKDHHAHFDYDAHIVSKDINLKSQGHIAENKHVSWTLKAEHLNDIVNDWPKGKLETSGVWNNGQTSGSFSGENLAWRGNTFATISTNWDIVQSPFYVKKATIQATHFSYPPLHLKKVNATVIGSRDKAKLIGRIWPDFPEWGLTATHFALDAHRQEGNKWQGRWEYFDMDGSHGLWALGAHPELSITPNGINQSHMCWALKKRALCFHWDWLDHKWELHFQGQNLPFDTWLSLNLPHFSVTGENRLTLNISEKHNEPVHADTEVELNSNIAYLPSPYLPVYIKHAHIKSSLTDSAWTADGTMKLEHNGLLHINGKLDRDESKGWSERPIHTTLTLKSDDFTPLTQLIPMLHLKHNTLDTHLTVTGPIIKPLISGKLNLTDADVTLPSLGTDLKGSSLKTNWNNNHVSYELDSKDSASPLTITGTGELDTEHWSLSSKATITGKNILIFNQPDYVVYANPNIKATLQDHNWMLGGKLTVLNTTIKPTTLTSSHSIPSDVTVIRSGNKKEKHEHLGLNVTLNIGKNVTIDTDMLKAVLSGKIHLEKKPGLHPFLGNGSVSVSDGKISILTSRYFINNAQLSYKNTPLTEPNLDIKIFRLIKRSHLTRHRKPRTVGLHITGPLKYPVILPFSSDPTLSNNDIVSYFAFNRPSDRGQPIHAASLLNALAELPNNGGNLDPKTRSMLIQQAIGFSELGEQSGASLANTGAPISGYDDAFVVGRYLSPNIYLRYTRGITSAYSIYQIRYNLSPSLAIQTESGTLGNGGDLLYSFTSLLHPKVSALKK